MTLSLTSTCVGGRRADEFTRFPERRHYSRRTIQEKAKELTPAERTACETVVRLGQYKLAANELGISVKTIELHIGSAKAKLGFTHSLHLFLHIHETTKGSQ